MDLRDYIRRLDELGAQTTRDLKRFYEDHRAEKLAFITEVKKKYLTFMLSNELYPFGLRESDDSVKNYGFVAIANEHIVINLDGVQCVFKYNDYRLREVKRNKGLFSFLYGPHHNYDKRIIKNRERLLRSGIKKMTELVMNLIQDHEGITNHSLNLNLKKIDDVGPAMFRIPFN